jgi:hypothetical protein
MVIRTLRTLLGLSVAAFTFWFCVYPLGTSLYYILFDSGLKGDGASRYAIRLHRNIAARYGDYARERIASGAATTLGVHQVAETEWPVYGSMFFLNATEALQTEWLRDRSRFPGEPTKYARGAIDGARDILLDPGHATWVRTYWGEDHLNQENCFYRFLVISGLSSHYRLTGDTSYLKFLREQAASLAALIDQSPRGLIDDYPGQCFPCDVGAALGAIQQADAILGTDHHAMLERAMRAFRDADSGELALPPYMADPSTGTARSPSRGCTNCFLASYVPRLWPKMAPSYYAALERDYWQANWFTAGFREFPRGTGRSWYFDVDAGPVAGGLGTSASGLGIGAARAHGRFDHARALSTEMIACSWQLPNGTNLVPSWVSHREHAPYFADIVNLFNLTRTPVPGSTAISGGLPPCVVWLILLVEAFVSLVLLRLAWRLVAQKKHNGVKEEQLG